MTALARSEASAAPGHVGRGAGIAVFFNIHARRVTFEAVEAVNRALPEATLVVTRTIAECEDEARKLALGESAVRLLLSGGGDGAIATLINAWAKTGKPLPPMGFLPLGTGNAWAHVTHAPKLERLLAALPGLRWPIPTRRFGLLDVDGTLCPFASVGWDAKLLSDFEKHRGSATAQMLPRFLRQGLGGYVASGLRFTLPEAMLSPRAEATVTSSEPWYRMGADERMEPQPAGILWRGRFGVLAMGTTSQYGFRFKAFPFAGAVPDMFNLRIYDRPLWRSLPDFPRLWRGRHPVKGMHDFFARHVRVKVQPPEPLQVAGDLQGAPQALDVQLASQSIEVVDWLGTQR